MGNNILMFEELKNLLFVDDSLFKFRGAFNSLTVDFFDSILLPCDLIFTQIHFPILPFSDYL